MTFLCSKHRLSFQFTCLFVCLFVTVSAAFMSNSAKWSRALIYSFEISGANCILSSFKGFRSGFQRGSNRSSLW